MMKASVESMVGGLVVENIELKVQLQFANSEIAQLRSLLSSANK